MHILIIDEVHPILMDELRRVGHQIDYSPTFSYEETYSIIQNYEGLIVRSGFFIDSKLIDKGVKLKFLARAGVGLDIFDLESAKNNNIKIINAAGANANSVAEHLIGLILSIMHKINKASAQVKSGQWLREENRGDELAGKTVAIIGYGHTGRAVAKKLKYFDCKVLAYDKHLTNFSDEFAVESTMEEIFEEADILSLHIPLTTDTAQMCDDSFFNRFKKDIYFLNTSRGKIVKLRALINAVDSGKIKGAGLDVLENEKMDSYSMEDKIVFEKLITIDNVILTPHVAGWSFQSFKNISEVLVIKIRLLTG